MSHVFPRRSGGTTPVAAGPSESALSTACQPATSVALGYADDTTGNAPARLAVTGMSSPFS